jgi:hypothetical protein
LFWMKFGPARTLRESSELESFGRTSSWRPCRSSKLRKENKLDVGGLKFSVHRFPNFEKVRLLSVY